jgi:hypothetical protein
LKKLHEKTSIVNPELYSKVNNKKIKYETKLEDIPNPKTHKQISFLKSAVRILGYAVLPLNIENAVILLIVSEAIGIIEELV